MSSASIALGTVVNDRYEVRLKLSFGGGMSETFLVYDRRDETLVVLKELTEEARSYHELALLRQSLDLTSRVKHRNVCRLYELLPPECGDILVMEFISGLGLYTHIRKQKKVANYTAADFRLIANDICAGVAALHEAGLVHCDIKPGNVIVSPDEESDALGRAVLINFDFVEEKSVLLSRKPDDPADAGTPNYMSPERIRTGRASQEDDVYAIGMTLWEMWKGKYSEPGHRPVVAREEISKIPGLPDGLSEEECLLVLQCLSENPEDRPNAKDLHFGPKQ